MVGPGITLNEAKEFARNFADVRSLPERTTSIDLSVAGPIGKWTTDFLFDYDIFPSFIMRFEAEWKSQGRRIRVGDVILQRAIIPPIGLGICIDFAVRICSVIEEEKRLGFAYETLAGHVERGISEFYFEDRGGLLAFTIHTYSEPAHWASRATRNLFTLPYQAWCTRRALQHVRDRFLQHNEGRS
jgi:hypothetical protein